jgi:thiol-disulfide isomerase/thioredoxin
MTLQKAIFILVTIAAVMGLLIYEPWKSHGAMAKDFTLADTRGRMVHLSELRGKVVVLDFWASWCPPCRAAMPAMDRLHNTYKDRGVAIYGVNINDDKDPREYMAAKGYAYPCLANGEDVAREYGVKGIPTFFVIGADGRILYRASGWGDDREADIAEAIELGLEGVTR